MQRDPFPRGSNLPFGTNLPQGPGGGGAAPGMRAQDLAAIIAKMLGGGIALSPFLRNEALGIARDGFSALQRINPFAGGQ